MHTKKYYHITDNTNVQSILKTGIQCNYKSAHSPFMSSSDKFDKHQDYTDRTGVLNVVFICEDPVLALAKMGSYTPIYRLAVIVVELPEEMVLKPSWCYEFELLHSGTIDPKYIVDSLYYTDFERVTA